MFLEAVREETFEVDPKELTNIAKIALNKIGYYFIKIIGKNFLCPEFTAGFFIEVHKEVAQFRK